MVCLLPNAGKAYWFWFYAAYQHHDGSSCEVHLWFWHLSQQWTDDEDPHLESSQLLLPPALQNLPGLPAHRVRYCTTVGFSIHFVATRLLQLTLVSSARVNHSASAACDECSSSSCHEPVIEWPCETSIWLPVEQRITYKLYLFTVSVHAPHPHQTSTTIPIQLCIQLASGKYQLRSTGSAVYVLPRTRTKFGERGFLYSSPATWYTLPFDLHDIIDASTFRKQLKSVLFDHAYHWLLSALLDVLYSGTLQILHWLVDEFTLVFRCQRSWWNLNGVNPMGTLNTGRVG